MSSALLALWLAGWIPIAIMVGDASIAGAWIVVGALWFSAVEHPP